jgi:hypothetical protein
MSHNVDAIYCDRYFRSLDHIRHKERASQPPQSLSEFLQTPFKMPLYEIGSALVSSAAVAPAMTVIDTAVVRSQFLNKSFAVSCKDSLQDYSRGRIPFRTPFSIMFGVYSATYATANLTELACRSAGVDYKIPTIVMASIANITAIAYKDKEFARMFGSSAKKVFPKLSFGLFALRDSITIASSFVAKKDFMEYLESRFGVEHKVADLVASLTVPMAAQIMSTPILILSLDLFTTPRASLIERIKSIFSKYPSVCAGRMFRVVPAFGIGGFINDMIRPRRDLEMHPIIHEYHYQMPHIVTESGVLTQ